MKPRKLRLSPKQKKVYNYLYDNPDSYIEERVNKVMIKPTDEQAPKMLSYKTLQGFPLRVVFEDHLSRRYKLKF